MVYVRTSTRPGACRDRSGQGLAHERGGNEARAEGGECERGLLVELQVIARKDVLDTADGWWADDRGSGRRPSALAIEAEAASEPPVREATPLATADSAAAVAALPVTGPSRSPRSW